MKICMVTDFPVDKNITRGGVESSVSLLVESLASFGHNIKVISVRPDVEDCVEVRGDYEIFWVRKNRFLPGFISYFTLDRIKVFKLIKKIQPELVHFQGAHGRSIGYKGKFVCTTHGLPEVDSAYSRFGKLKSILLRYIENYARKKCNNHILLNRYTENLLPNVFFPNIKYIPNPIRTCFFTTNKKRSSTNDLLFIGNISRLKNLLFSLKILLKIIESGMQTSLIIAGPIVDKAYYEECLTFIKKHKLERNVEFVGNVSAVELVEIYKRVAFTLVFSLQENSPMIVSESMATGTPVVSINDFGMKFMIKHAENGLLVNGYDVTKASNFIIENIINGKCNMLSVNASITAKAIYHSDSVLIATNDFYSVILND